MNVASGDEDQSAAPRPQLSTLTRTRFAREVLAILRGARELEVGEAWPGRKPRWELWCLTSSDEKACSYMGKFGVSRIMPALAEYASDKVEGMSQRVAARPQAGGRP